MEIKKTLTKFMEDIKGSFTISTKQSCLKRLGPRTVIPKDQFVRNGNKESPNGDVDNFYEIDIEGNIAFYLVCDGRKSLDWILEDLTSKVSIKNRYIYFELIVGAKSMVFSFALDDKDSLYSLIRIIVQPNVMLYYLMEDNMQYIYLGYNEIEISKEIKEDIISNITLKKGFSLSI